MYKVFGGAKELTFNCLTYQSYHEYLRLVSFLHSVTCRLSLCPIFFFLKYMVPNFIHMHLLRGTKEMKWQQRMLIDCGPFLLRFDNILRSLCSTLMLSTSFVIYVSLQYSHNIWSMHDQWTILLLSHVHFVRMWED